MAVRFPIATARGAQPVRAAVPPREAGVRGLRTALMAAPPREAGVRGRGLVGTAIPLMAGTADITGPITAAPTGIMAVPITAGPPLLLPAIQAGARPQRAQPSVPRPLLRPRPQPMPTRV